MKRVLALALAAMMLFALAACGEDTATPTTTAPAAGSSLELGKVNGLTWENEFIGLGCTLTSDWTFKTDEEIRQLNNIVEDALDADLADRFGEEIEATAAEIATLIRRALPEHLLPEYRLANMLAALPVLDTLVESLIERGILTPPEDGVGAEGCYMFLQK